MSLLNFAYIEGFEPAIIDGKKMMPERHSEGAAGIDIPLPEFNDAFVHSFLEYNEDREGSFDLNLKKKEISFKPDSNLIFPSGLCFDIPPNTYLDVANRGSMSAKFGIVHGAHIIDEDYTGMVFINLMNLSNKSVVFTPGMRIAQIIHKHYIPSVPVVASYTALSKKATLRGEGALGSTGK